MRISPGEMQGMAAERQGGLVIGRTSTGTALARAICSSKLGPVRRIEEFGDKVPLDTQTQCTQMKRRDVFTQVVDRAERMRGERAAGRGAGGRGPRLRRSHRYAQPELQQWVSRGG